MLITSPLIAWNYEKVFLKSVILAAILNIGLNFLIIPHFKAVGVSYVIVFTEAVTNMFLFYYYKKIFGFNEYLNVLKYFIFSFAKFF
jgi:O-antigen/teichoic acid export membrane protein